MSPSSSTDPFILPTRMRRLKAAARLLAVNPFEPACQEHLKEVLGDRVVPEDGPEGSRGRAFAANLERLQEPLGLMVSGCAAQLADGVQATSKELEIYRGAALFGLWIAYSRELQEIIDRDEVDVRFFDRFLDNYRFLFGRLPLPVPTPAHLLGLYYQARRTWYFAATKIFGTSPSAAAARAAIWRASMGGDICLYAESLYRRMDEVPVLITGQTGTGKELAAECLGWSRYIPCDPEARRFARRHREDFHVRNLCAISPELLESELFGHVRGAFTGATADRVGFFALVKAHGSLFLDEIGEAPLHVQAKLLRPLQSREIVPVGSVVSRPIQGRLLFATNRRLEEECQKGTFRADLFERMNGVRIHMTSLRRMLDEAPGDLRHYVRELVADKIDSPARAERWTERVMASIRVERPGHPWPNNVRELKNYTDRIILGQTEAPAVDSSAPAAPPPAERRPTTRPPPSPPGAPESACQPSSEILGEKAKAGEVTLEEAGRALMTQVYVLTDQNVAETARKTGVDRKTVRRWIDPERLARLLKRKDKDKK